MGQLDGKQIKNDSLSLGKVITDDESIITLTNGTKIQQVLIPTDGSDLANKNYVDSLASGLDPKQSVKVISLVDISLSGLQTIDGYTLQTGDRILVNGQSSASENGIYVADSGAWVRSLDADGNPNNEVSLGNYSFVELGATYSGSGWVLNETNALGATISVGVDTQNWTQFSSAGSYTAGDGLKLTTAGGGGEFSIDDNVVSGDGITASNGVFNIDLKDNSGLTVDGNGLSVDNTIAGTGLSITDGIIEVNTNNGITTNGDDIVIDDNTIAGAGLTSNSGVMSVNVSNGLNIDGDDVELGGTLDKATTIAGAGNDLTFGNIGTLSATAATNITFENTLHKMDFNDFNGWSITTLPYGGPDDTYIWLEKDSGIELKTNKSGNNLTINANHLNATALIQAGDPSEGKATIRLYGTGSNTMIFTDSKNDKGAVYAGDYENNFTNRSLVTKKYVDDATALINADFITAVDAGSGLTGSATSGTASLSVNTTNGISIIDDSVGLGGTVSTPDTTIFIDDGIEMFMNVSTASGSGLTIKSNDDKANIYISGEDGSSARISHSDIGSLNFSNGYMQVSDTRGTKVGLEY
jgi:hypothetical protein